MNWFDFVMRWINKSIPPSPPPSIPVRFVMSDSEQRMFVCEVNDKNRVDFIERGHTPSWTPDGEIIFASPGGDEIKIMDVNGRNVRSVVRRLRGINKPHMVGDKILFTTTEHGNMGKLWVMRKDGSELKMLTPSGTAGFLAPDGMWATFTRETAGPPMHRQIWRINIDGSRERQLTYLNMDPAHPDGNASAISGDGKTVAVFWGPEDDGTNSSPDRWGQRDLAAMGADGGKPRVIVAATPARQPGFPGNYPPLPALLAADNPAPWRDGDGVDWWVFDGGRPDSGAGTFKVRVGGGEITRLSGFYRGGGNVPIR